MSDDRYEAVIGLEIHAQLLTHSKAFSSAEVRYGAAPNTLVNEVCSGQPGSLPVVNKAAVEMAIKAGLALNCAIQPRSIWARKNYFYPDLPKGYQISQYEHPICLGGWVEIEVGDEVKRVGLERIQMEEDTGKSLHEGDEPTSLIDLNRAGTPLVEIVSNPDMRTAEEAAAYFREIRAILVALGINDGNLQEGSMRCDGNVSVRKRGELKFGTKVEVKNLNSFRYLRDAIDYEIKRQIEALEAGEPLYQETRLWNEQRGQTVLMRRKEGSADYRYFPEPDLPPLDVTSAEVERIRSTMPELPSAARERLRVKHGLSRYDSNVVVASEGLLTTFDAALETGATAKGVVNWLTGSLAAAVNAGTLQWDENAKTFANVSTSAKVGGARIGGLQRLIDDGSISTAIGRQVWDEMVVTGEDATKIVDAKGLRTVSDTGALEAAIDEVMAALPDEVARYRGGKVQLMGVFVGAVMKKMGGKADPKSLNQLLREKLGPATPA
jgi:aspartyl-tRNA(Asn)/glutamyl-tRNA(Gln) amidotransferase subunit B